MLHYQTVLPETLTLLQQLTLLPSLSQMRFVGGTNLALQIGHRISIDLDFFGPELVGGAEQLFHELSALGNVSLLADSTSIHQYVVAGVEVDVVVQPYKWLENPIRIDGLCLATKFDIAAMKLLAIMNRGSRKDFIDLSFLLEHYSLDKMIVAALKKYPALTPFGLCKSLLYFEDAEQDPMPRMLLDCSWEKVVERISQNVNIYLAKQ